jgi:hypothetical protein
MAQLAAAAEEMAEDEYDGGALANTKVRKPPKLAQTLGQP